jgi:6-phosphogluconolactonase (cycloisomerase 2 family)
MKAMALLRRELLSMGSLLLGGGAAAAEQSAFLHVGTYAPQGKGIYRFALDATSGALRLLGITANAHSPSWLHADASTRRVYAAEEGGDHVSVYQQRPDGDLQLLQRLPSGGRGPVHLSLAQGRLWVAHYGDARLAALAVNNEGRLAEALSWPSAADGQGKGHAHMLQSSPDGRWLLASDLGLDRLQAWPLQGGAWPPAPPRSLQFKPRSGPRHFVFHPQQPDLVYLLQELSNRLSTVRLGADGPELLDEVSVLPADFSGTSYASDLLLAPGGGHLYALNRLHNSIAVLSLAEPERPRLLDHHSTQGDYPRSACRVGRHLYVCNQRSHQLCHFELDDPARPRFSGQQIAVPSPAVACALPA